MPLDSTRLDNANSIVAIAINGAMNPAIHHPSWYRFIGAITEEEAQAAVSTTVNVPAGSTVQIQLDQAFCSPQLSQFRAGNVQITCTPENWTIMAPRQMELSRVKEITGKVFSALTHTPVSAYSVSYYEHLETSVGDVGASLARALQIAPLGIVVEPDASSETAQIRYVFQINGCELAVDIQPSVRARQMIYIGISAACRIAAEAEFRQFELTPLVDELLTFVHRKSEKWLASVLVAVSRGAE